MSFLSQDPSVYIIDQGGSYEKLTKMVGGSYISFNDTNISINPLGGYKKNWEEKIGFRSAVLKEMIRDSKFGTVEKAEEIIIERMLQVLYRRFESRKEDPTLSDAYELLTTQVLYEPEKEREMETAQKKIILYLQKWTRVGSKGTSYYAKILDNPYTTVTMDNSFVTFDLLGIKNYPDLMKVIFRVLNELIVDIVKQERQRPKIIVFDEVWALLKSEEGAIFIEELYRTMRKYNCMVLSISQDIEDFSNSSVAGALLTNTFQTFVLRQSADFNIDKIQNILKLNDSETSLVSNLRQRPGYYSEIFMRITEIGSSRVTIVPSPLEYWVATTSAKDIQVYNDLISRGTPVLRALEILANEYPNGVSAKQSR